MTKQMNKIVNELASIYKFDVEEALSKLKRKLPVPFDGNVKEECCRALRKNNFLFTQCTVIAKYGSFCKGCKNGEKYGTIDDRVKVDMMDYVDPKGNKVKSFTEVLYRKNITEEDAQEYALQKNIEIDNIHWTPFRTTPKRARKPKKTQEKVDMDIVQEKVDMDIVQEKVDMDIEVKEDTVDIIVEQQQPETKQDAAAVQEKPKKERKPRQKKQPPNKEEKQPVEEKSNDKEEEEEEKVKKIKYENNFYLLSKTNDIYDIDTNDLIGTYIPKTKKIFFFNDDDDDE